jgi:hypothetical protein
MSLVKVETFYYSQPVAQQSRSAALRALLRVRAEDWAASTACSFYRSLGSQPTVLFKPAGDGSRHGNFHPASWAAIRDNGDWISRLGKRHSQLAALPEGERLQARELDSSNSSDALLMNCFCYPGALPGIMAGLGLDPGPAPGDPQFGYLPRLPLVGGGTDATEIDLRVGRLLFEAKLTESTFTSRRRSHVERYHHLADVFDRERLPGDDTMIRGYQVIRNVLAAFETSGVSVVLIDERRSDLHDEWRTVTQAIVLRELASRCILATWQQLARSVPADLGDFLAAKYAL